MEPTEKIETLKRSPLFAMSLASKELFHSNFWAWLFERNIEYAKIFFSEIKSIDENGVKREERHRDITIHYGNNLYVIENKIKSIPNVKQLNEYSDDIKKQHKNLVSGVITGISRPSFDCPEQWIFLSYTEIGKKIQSTAERIEKDSFEKSLILEYSQMIRQISEIMNEYSNRFKNQLVGWDNYEKITDIRMDDVLKKLKADEFVKYLSNELSTVICNSIGEYKLEIKSDYSNKSSIVDIRYIQKNDQNLFTLIGVQIQGTQYRRCIQIYGAKEITVINLPENWFDLNFQKGDKSIWNGKRTSMKKTFDSYSDNKTYTFIYQYYNIDDLSFDSLKEKIVEDMKIVKEIVAEKKTNSLKI